jgi:hypothetical protein
MIRVRVIKYCIVTVNSVLSLFYVAFFEKIDHGFGIKDIIRCRSHVEIVDGAYDYH